MGLGKSLAAGYLGAKILFGLAVSQKLPLKSISRTKKTKQKREVEKWDE